MEKDTITKELAKFNITDSAIAELSNRYMGLTIKGLDDKPGFDAVHRGRIDVKERRISVEKTRKELKEDSLRYGQAVDKEAKRIFLLLSPIEDHLSDEENRVTEEKSRIKAEADAKVAAIIQNRINRLFELGCRFDGTNYIYGTLIAPQTLIKTCTDEQFSTFEETLRVAVEADAQKREAEDKARQEEATRLLKVAKEQEAERNRINAEYKALQDEKDRLAKEKREAENAKIKAEQDKIFAAEMEKAKAEAAEKARIETEERIKREAEAKIAKEAAAKLRAEKKEARRPDREKLITYAETFMDYIPTPEMKTDEGKAVFGEVKILLKKAGMDIRALVEKL